MSTYPLRGKRIWLIGASHGIGEALAYDLGIKGAKLVLSARSVSKLEDIAQKCASACCVISCDVTDNTIVTQAAHEAIAAYNGIDMIIYNAGAYDPMSSADFDLEKVENIIDVNLHGAIRVVHAILPTLKAQNSGTIALVGSVAGYRGLPKSMGYGLSKSALIHFAENLKQDLSDTDINVRLISPGFVKTRLTDKNDFEMPMRISPQQASQAIIDGLESGAYEIHFPKKFTFIMKAISLLPAKVFFWLSSKLL